MPEIAEVETVRNTLKKQILNKKINKVQVYYERIIESDLKEFKEKLINQSFIDIKRKGKWLIFETNDYYLLSHLRMEGKFFLKDNNQEKMKHEHIIFTFDDNTDLRYHDTRKFGKMNLINKDELNENEAIKKQGIEPIDKNLNANYLLEKFKNKRLAIKTTLLDQTIISGLGNIYADEVLFQAGIHPERKTESIKKKEAEKIVVACNDIITRAIRDGGTTIKSYTSSLGVTGLFQQSLMVHQQANKPCKICGSIIKKITVNGRGTYFCPKCQK